MGVREELHRIIDALPEGEMHAARRYLEYLRKASDPLLRAFMEAPEDDELETEEERAAVAEAHEDLKAGRVVPLEEVKREFGL